RPERSARGLPLDVEIAGVNGLERVRGDLSRLAVEMDVVAVEVHLPVGVAAHVDGHGVVLVGGQLARLHRGGGGDCYVNGPVDAPMSAVGVDQDSAAEREHDDDGGHDGYTSASQLEISSSKSARRSRAG